MIDAAIPQAGAPDDAKLASIDAGTLARYILDTTHPWWRRRPCVHALRGRVPEAHVPALLERVRDLEEVSEVRVALLELLGDRAELLPYLQTLDSAPRYGVAEQALAARGRQGDLTAARGLAELAASPWASYSTLGEAGLDALVARHGSAAVVGAVGEATVEGRIFANRMRSREGGELIAALADAAPAVARRAVELIVQTGRPDDDHLRDHVVTGPNLAARLWALYALHRRGTDPRALWQAIDEPVVEVPGLPADVRAAIVREYPGELACDPRWLLEQVCRSAPAFDEAAQLSRVLGALADARLAPGAPVSAGAANGSGGGTYHVIATSRGELLISTLGPFATGGSDEGALREVLGAAGLRWIDGELGAIVVPRLPVYYFGDREPLDVRTLLFYWQD